MFEIEHMPSMINLGYVGETNFRTIEIDLTPWAREMPDGVPSIVVIRPRESSAMAFIAATHYNEGEVADNILRWTPSAGEIGPLNGNGQIQVWMEDEENDSVVKRGKCKAIATFVDSTLPDASSEIPEAQESWMEQMTALKTATVQAAADAADSADDAVTSALSASGSATQAGTYAGQALTMRNSAQQYAQAAQGYATTAQTAAGQALEYKGAAETAADSASDSATAADASADAAEGFKDAAAALVGQITQEAEEAVSSIEEAVDNAEIDIGAIASQAVSDIEEAIDAAPKLYYLSASAFADSGKIRTSGGKTIKRYDLRCTNSIGSEDWNLKSGDIILVSTTIAVNSPTDDPIDVGIEYKYNNSGTYTLVYCKATNLEGIQYPLGTPLFAAGQYYAFRYYSKYLNTKMVVALDFSKDTKTSEVNAADYADLSRGYADGKHLDGTVNPLYSENNANYYLTLTRQAKKDAEDTVDGAKQEIDDEGAAQVQAVEDKGAEVLESIPADYSAMTEEVAAAAQDVTAQELLAILLQETQLTETMLISIGATFDALPQDETATDIMYSLKLEADRLQLVYENWLEEREGA